MGVSKNVIDRSDVSTYPIKVKYSASYASESLFSYGITVNRGINSSYSKSGSYSSNYSLVKQLYYQEYLTGSLLQSSSAWNSSPQSTAADGTLDNDYRYFPNFSNANLTILAIPRTSFGENISRGSLSIVGTNYSLYDDGNGNVLSGSTHVGNILYSQGVIVITNPDYQNAMIPEYVAPEIPYDYYSATTYPCSTCSPGSSIDVRVLQGTPITIGSYYLPQTPNGNSYRIYLGPIINYVDNTGLTIINSTEYSSCATACGITTTTTSTTTSTTTAAPTTTTSTTTSTTTAAPTTTSTTTAAPTTTTSTTTSTTTAAPTTTTSTTTSTTTTAPTTTTTSTTTSTTTVAFDVLAGSFTVNNTAGGFAVVSVDLGGYGTNNTVAIGSNRTFATSGNMNSTPAVFTISAVGLVDPVNITGNTLACTGATINVTGGGTSTVTVTITPTNYNGSTDTLSGTLTVLTS